MLACQLPSSWNWIILVPLALPELTPNLLTGADCNSRTYPTGVLIYLLQNVHILRTVLLYVFLLLLFSIFVKVRRFQSETD